MTGIIIFNLSELTGYPLPVFGAGYEGKSY
jgi:hypothetical protein